MPDNNENKDVFIRDGSMLVDPDTLLTSEERQAKYQREHDEMFTRAVIRVVSENAELRRELLQALGLED